MQILNFRSLNTTSVQDYNVHDYLHLVSEILTQVSMRIEARKELRAQLHSGKGRRDHAKARAHHNLFLHTKLIT